MSLCLCRPNTDTWDASPWMVMIASVRMNIFWIARDWGCLSLTLRQSCGLYPAKYFSRPITSLVGCFFFNQGTHSMESSCDNFHYTSFQNHFEIEELKIEDNSWNKDLPKLSSSLMSSCRTVHLYWWGKQLVVLEGLSFPFHWWSCSLINREGCKIQKCFIWIGISVFMEITSKYLFGSTHA